MSEAAPAAAHSSAVHFISVASKRRRKTASHVTKQFVRCEADPLAVTAGVSSVRLRIPKGHGINPYDQIVLDNILSLSYNVDTSVTIGTATVSWSVSRLASGIGVLVQGMPEDVTFTVPLLISGFEASVIPRGVLDGVQDVAVRVEGTLVSFSIDAAGKTWPALDGSYQATFTLKNMHIGGIPLRDIQANLPSDSTHGAGSRTVLAVDDDTLVMQTGSAALYDVSNVGGGDVFFAQIMSISPGHANPTSYYDTFERTYTAVSRLQVVGTEFPCTVVNVHEGWELAYSGLSYPFLSRQTAKVGRGSYSSRSLAEALVRSMNEREYIVGNKRRIFSASVADTSVTLRCRVLVSLRVDDMTVTKELQRIQFRVGDHGLLDGDLVYIKWGAREGLESGSFPVVVVDGDNDSFGIAVTDRLLSALPSEGYVELELPSRFRFEASPLLGILGLQGPSSFGSDHSSTLPLAVWPYPYIELRLRTDQQVDGVTPVLLSSDILLNRIRLDEEKIGRTLIDYHVKDYIVELHPPLESVSGINVFLSWPDGSLPDFNGADHSFTMSLGAA